MLQLHRLRAVASACLEDYEAALGGCGRWVLEGKSLVGFCATQSLTPHQHTVACLHTHTGTTDDAEAVIELAPSNPDGYYHKGFALMQLSDYAGAVSKRGEGASTQCQQNLRTICEVAASYSQTEWILATNWFRPRHACSCAVLIGICQAD